MGGRETARNSEREDIDEEYVSERDRREAERARRRRCDITI